MLILFRVFSFIAIAAVLFGAGPGAAASTPETLRRQMRAVEHDAAEVATAEVEQATGTGPRPRPRHTEATGDPLEFKTDLALWTAVVFGLLLVVLRGFAWGPIRDGLDRRERGIADDVAQAKEAKRRADELLREYERKLAHTADEARVMLDRARREAEEVGLRLLEKAKADAEAQREQGIREIEAAHRGALKELAHRSADMAVLLAGRIVGAELKPADHVRLVNEAVDAFSVNPDKA